MALKSINIIQRPDMRENSIRCTSCFIQNRLFEHKKRVRYNNWLGNGKSCCRVKKNIARKYDYLDAKSIYQDDSLAKGGRC